MYFPLEWIPLLHFEEWSILWLRGLPNTSAYIDDLITGSDTWEGHITDVEKLFQRLSEANLIVNLAKTEFGCASVTYLGHVIGQGKVAPVDGKIQTIVSYPVPTNKRALRRFLGMVGYYCKFCKNFDDVKNDKKLKFLFSPDFGKPFALAVDASDDAAGAV